MTVDQILNAVGGADDAMLAVCEAIPPARHTVWKWASAAAGFTILIFAAAAVLRGTRSPLPQPQPAPSVSLPAVVTESETTRRTEPDSDGETDIVFPPYNAPAQMPTGVINGGGETQAGPGRTGEKYGDTEADALPGGETQTVSDGLWQNAPITTKYPYLHWNGQTYTSRGRAQLNGNVQNRVLGSATLQGFDNDPAHRTTAEILPISGIAADAAVAVRFGDETAYAYVCQSYAPGTLGQLMDDLRLREHCTIIGANGCGGDLAATVFSAPAAGEVWTLFDRAAPLDDTAALHPATALVRYNLPLLGQTPGSFAVTEDGWLLVDFCERELAYRIGSARAAAFLDYLNRECHPTKLAERTTAAYTQTPAEADTVPTGR